MIDLSTLQAAAFKAELASSRRLMASAGLSETEALRRILGRSAGAAGLDHLLAARAAQRLHAEQQTARRAASATAARARQAAAGQYTWRAWFDGSARPNPGRCGLGAVLVGPDGQRIELSQDGGHGNSSEAEYRALIAVLRAALAHGAHDLAVHGDSQVVVDDVNGPDVASAPSLRGYRLEALALLARLRSTGTGSASVRWIPRHKNLDADALSQRAFPSPTQEHTQEHTP